MLMHDVNHAIETCLDPQALGRHLQPHIAARGAIDAVRITQSRRSSSRAKHPHPLVFCCEIDLRGAATPQRWLGKLHRAGASAAAWPGAPVLHLPELELLLWPWPQDPGLPQLARLLDVRAVMPIWGHAAAGVQTLRYEPGQRALLRYTHGDADPLYAKTYADPRGPVVRRRFEWIWAASQADARYPRVARPLAVADPHTLWQASVGGTPLPQLLDDAQRGDWIRPLALAVAMLHAAPAELAGPSPRGRQHWLTEVQRRRSKIERACPELAPQAGAVAEAITRAAPALPPYAPSLIHGDLHADQARLEGGRIVLFDFDEFALGDPMEDLAGFIVKLPPAVQTSKLAPLWLAAYAHAAPQRFCRARLAWHLAVQQLLQASRAFVFQLPQWRSQVRDRLERARQLAAALDTQGSR